MAISLASTEFHKIPWKRINSAETGKFRGSAQNSAFLGNLCSLLITTQKVLQMSCFNVRVCVTWWQRWKKALQMSCQTFVYVSKNVKLWSSTTLNGRQKFITAVMDIEEIQITVPCKQTPSITVQLAAIGIRMMYVCLSVCDALAIQHAGRSCVRWLVTLCDPIWQVMSCSSEVGFPPGRAISAFTFISVLVVQRFGVGLMIKRSLVRRLPEALSSQLGQLSLPSLRGK